MARQGVSIRRFPVCHLPWVGLTYPGLRRLLWLLSRTRVTPVAVLNRISRFTPWLPDLLRWSSQRAPTTAAHSPGQSDPVAATPICAEPILLAGLRYARLNRLPFVSYPLTHLGAGLRPGEDPLSRFYTMRHQVALARASDAVVAMTNDEAAFYVERGVRAENLVVVGPGVRPEAVLGGDGATWRAKHGAKGPIVATLSTLMYDKGTVHVVEAIRHLWAQGRDVELVLAGALLEPFAQYLASLPPDVRQRIRVLGPVDDQEKRDLFAASDVFAMPSRTDSFGIVYLEAWLYGKPVIGARTWGVMDVIRDGVDGLLVPFGDIDRLTTALGNLLDNPERRQTMGEAGRTKVYAEHTWDKKFPKIEALYLRLAEGRH
jgi:glycosyltransferase involved in cell wall biosynthesis